MAKWIYIIGSVGLLLLMVVVLPHEDFTLSQLRLNVPLAKHINGKDVIFMQSERDWVHGELFGIVVGTASPSVAAAIGERVPFGSCGETDNQCTPWSSISDTQQNDILSRNWPLGGKVTVVVNDIRKHSRCATRYLADATGKTHTRSVDRETLCMSTSGEFVYVYSHL